MSRIVCQFSCGAASAVATKLALAKCGAVEIINAFLMEEHEDNRRFAADCERWFGRPITMLRDGLRPRHRRLRMPPRYHPRAACECRGADA